MSIPLILGIYVRQNALPVGADAHFYELNGVLYLSLLGLRTMLVQESPTLRPCNILSRYSHF